MQGSSDANPDGAAKKQTALSGRERMKTVAFKMPSEDYETTKGVFERNGLTVGAGIRFALTEFVRKHTEPSGRVRLWKVTLDGKVIDRLFYLGNVNAEEVRSYLIREEKADPSIVVDEDRI